MLTDFFGIPYRDPGYRTPRSITRFNGWADDAASFRRQTGGTVSRQRILGTIVDAEGQTWHRVDGSWHKEWGALDDMSPEEIRELEQTL